MLCYLALALALQVSHCENETYFAVDGDTIIAKSTGERIRLLGVDTAEIHPCRCPEECRLGAAAKEMTQRLLDGGYVVIDRLGHLDRYNRTLAWVSANGDDIGQRLIADGLGRPYKGGRRRSWCG